jgi:hypothetical protein
MADLRVLALATDPNLVPGIYNGCDQWCHYCPATERCLAHRCRPALENGRSLYENIEERMLESMRYLKQCYDAEGLEAPEELVRMLSGERPTSAPCLPIDDPLERMGKHYAVLATAFLASCDRLPEMPLPKREHGPTPFDVFLFYHVLIAIKIYRAISSAREAARSGSAQARWDADVSAKVALIGIDRSDDALQVLTLDDDDPRIGHLRRHLARLRREVDGRFPAARALVRPGLDSVPSSDVNVAGR